MKNYSTNPKLDKLVDDEDWEYHIDAARQGYGLDKLINDDSRVREIL